MESVPGAVATESVDSRISVYRSLHRNPRKNPAALSKLPVNSPDPLC